MTVKMMRFKDSNQIISDSEDNQILFLVFHSRMWMAYSEAAYPIAEDLYTAVQRLKCLLRDLEFEAEHSINYDYGTFRSYEQINELAKDAENYYKGGETCQAFLDGTINIENLCGRFIYLGLKNKLHDIGKFLPEHLAVKFNLIDGTEDDGEDSNI